jgi:hypothetical protein
VVIVRGGFEAFSGMTNLGLRSAFMPMIAKNEAMTTKLSLSYAADPVRYAA